MRQISGFHSSVNAAMWYADYIQSQTTMRETECRLTRRMASIFPLRGTLLYAVAHMAHAPAEIDATSRSI